MLPIDSVEQITLENRQHSAENIPAVSHTLSTQQSASEHAALTRISQAKHNIQKSTTPGFRAQLFFGSCTEGLAEITSGLTYESTIPIGSPQGLGTHCEEGKSFTSPL